MEKLNLIISQNLLYLRKKFGFKQSDIAKKLNYSDKMVSKWEKGDNIPSIENLCALADIYGVSLDDIVKSKIEDNEKIEIKNYKQQRNNKIIITLLAISVIWILATVIFVNLNLVSIKGAWLAFIWAIPVSSIVGIVFCAVWKNYKLNYILISILIWSIITCFYLQFLKYNLFQLFFIGVPAQIVILLWSRLKIKITEKKSTSTTDKNKLENTVSQTDAD